MRKVFVILFVCVCTALQAQTVDVQVEKSFAPDINGDSVLVRAYNDRYEIVSIREGIHNIPNTASLFPPPTTFLIRDLNDFDSSILSLGSLPGNYIINDIQFIRLGLNGVSDSIDYCVFCGTRISIVDEYWTLPDEDGNSNYVIQTDTSGFVGFFSMLDALNPDTTGVIRYRDIEWTTSLDKMAVYAEHQSLHFDPSKTSLIDNAVVDVIGKADTNLNRQSCICRVKFYPDFNGGVLWDNNIRSSSTPSEEVLDIVGTDSYVVTVSQLASDNNRLLLRVSDKEHVLHYGGLELDSIVFIYDLQYLYATSAIDQSPNNRFRDPVRLCRLRGDTVNLVFQLYINSSSPTDVGVVTIKIPCSNPGMATATYCKGEYELRDVDYHKRSNKMSYLLWETQSSNPHVYFAVGNTSMKGINVGNSHTRSLSLYSYESSCYALFGGDERTSASDHLFLGRQQFVSDFKTDCYESVIQPVSDVSITNISTGVYAFTIQERFLNNPVNYPTGQTTFQPQREVLDVNCSESVTTAN